MAKKTKRGGAGSRYYLAFGLIALLLLSATLVLVLGVLPRRYVLSARFRESGLSFPSPGVPFVPPDAVQIAARPVATPPTPDEIVRGPAEIFWAQVIPLLERERYGEALPFFERYLLDYPADDDVRRELALTLLAAGRGDEATAVLAGLLRSGEDPELRLLLARTLRDLERVDEASIHYAILAAASPADEALALEWAQALAWMEAYAGAERVLLSALERAPESVPLRVELARVYYYTDRLIEAEAILDAMTDAELSAARARVLLADVRAALAVPEEEEVIVVPPTLLERAVGAREDDDFGTALMLFEMAILENPESAEILLAYANFLEYELSDFEGAREALLEAERLGMTDAQLQFRLALLEAWTGSSPEAMSRLEALFATLRSGEAAVPTPDETDEETDAPPVTVADVQALMGDLHRWDGERIKAAGLYETALVTDDENQRALEGLEAIRIEVALLIDDIEAPRMGSHAYGVGDTDDFGRFDLAGEWIGVKDEWVWNASVGNRWMGGRDLDAALTSQRGMYVEVTPARWWRWGTIRTALHLGAQWVRAGEPDVSFGAALRYRGLGGATFNAEYIHEPAYSLAATLQSVLARLSHDRFLASFGKALDERWNIAVQADVSLLDPAALDGASGSTRLQVAVSISRAMTQNWTLGWSTVAMTYSDPSPRVGGDLRLFWDPAMVLAAGPYAQLRGPLSENWEGSIRVSPGFALIDERGPTGFEAVPQLSAEARLEYVGPRYQSAVDFFYSQSRVEGYRSYGLRFSLSAKSWLSKAPDR